MKYPAISSPLQPQRRLLYIGVDLDLLKAVQEALKDEEWLVVRCPDGSTARTFIESDIQYELLLFDKEVPGTSGIELVRLVHSLEHRKRTPIILLSLKDCAAEARRARATEFLWKPERIHTLVETIRRLLASSGSKLKIKVQGQTRMANLDPLSFIPPCRSPSSCVRRSLLRSRSLSVRGCLQL